MRKIIYIGLLLCAVIGVKAEVLVLQSGKTIAGEILMQNEDIVMLRDGDGHKFQFPRSEVKEIQMSATKVEEKKVVTSTSGKGNCALRLDMSGGGLFVPSLNNGGYGAIDIQIGSRYIGEKRIFLGGSVGYQAAVTDKTYHFLPLMAVVSVPLKEGKHAPELGAALGYGFAIKNPDKGGVVAKVDVSCRYQYRNTSALLLGVQARWQQANVRYMEVVDRKEYASTLGRNFASIGLRLALEF